VSELYINIIIFTINFSV